MECNRIIKCPRCKSEEIELIEIWNGSSISFMLEGMMVDLNDGYKAYGYPVRVEAKCTDCEHQWKLRNITQITDLEKEDTNG